MPRQRRRRRRQAASAQPGTTPSAADGGAVRERRSSDPAPPTSSRRRWLPTLGVAFAFSLGLWLGGLLSVTDTASAIALLGGVVGLGLTGARMLRHWIVRRRTQAIRDRRDRQDHLADQEERRRRYSVPANSSDSSRRAD